MQLLPPIPKSSYKSRLEPVINNVLAGISVKVFGPHGVGKTSVYNWLANSASLQKTLKIPTNTNIQYFDLELTTIKSENDLVLGEINAAIEIINKDRQKRFVCILDSAGVLEYNHELQGFLSKNYQKLRPRLSFIFLFSKFYKDGGLVKQIPLLKIPLGEFSTFFPLFNIGEIEYSITQWEKTLNTKFSIQEKDWLICQSGGYAALNKKLIFVLKENPNLVKDEKILDNYPAVTNVLDRLCTSFDKSHMEILSDWPKNKKEKEENKILKNFGVINEKEKLFNPLFEEYLVSKKRLKHEHFGINFSENLTASELKLLGVLHKNSDKIVDRDTLAQAIWGKAWLEKYSDWAIDKIVSQIRQKIADNKDRKKLATFRGRGLRLSVIGD